MVALAVRLKGENEQLAKKNEELQKALEDQGAALEKLVSDQFTALKSKEDALTPDGAYGKRTKYCDKGTYMVGITHADSDGGPHGIIYAVRPICRSM